MSPRKTFFTGLKLKNKKPVIPPTTHGITRNISFEEIVIIPATKRKNLIDKRADKPSIPSIRLNAFTITINTKIETVKNGTLTDFSKKGLYLFLINNFNAVSILN